MCVHTTVLTTGRRLVGAPLAGNTSRGWRHVTDNRGIQAVAVEQSIYKARSSCGCSCICQLQSPHLYSLQISHDTVYRALKGRGTQKSEVPKMTEFQLAAYKLFRCIRACSLGETRYRVAKKKTKSVMFSNAISLLESYIQRVHPKCPPNTPSTRSISRLSHLWSIRTIITQSRMERAEKVAGLWALMKLVEGVSGQYLVQWETLTLCSRAR